jgi:pyruvate/2-oxoglutarate dehydrogenase complex dihydrolipoamide dehydrogenase (E3) component
MTSFEYDIVAVGGGTAGLVTAAGASYLGARAGLVEEDALGGDCLWTGCVPSKSLVASARLAHAMKDAEAMGLTGWAPAHAFREVMERMRRARAVVARHDDPDRFRRLGVGVHRGTARFLGPGTLEVQGVGTIRSRRIVLSTGAVPRIPHIPGLREAGFLSTRTAFQQDSLPSSLVMLGGGPVGLELAQVYRRLGAEVTVVEMEPRILPLEDEDVSRSLQEILEREGIRFRLGVEGIGVGRDGEMRTLELEDGTRVQGRELFVATGRNPRTEGLELGRAGVEREGLALKVDPRLRTTGQGIWGAGDVTGGPMFTHVADAMARVVVRNALLPLSRPMVMDAVPRVTYTDPEVAHVGLGQEEGEARGGRTFTYPFKELDRAIVDGETGGFAKVTADRRGRILGATILGQGAGDLLFPLILARENGLSLADLANTVFPYPTRVEVLKRVADAFQRTRLEGRGGILLKKLVSWLS